MKKILSTLALFLMMAMTINANTNPVITNDDEVTPEAVAEIIKADCPKTVGDGLVMVDATYKDGYIAVGVSCDENKINMDDLEKVRDDLKLEMLKGLGCDSTLMPLYEQGVGYIYVYKGSSTGKIVYVVIEASDVLAQGVVDEINAASPSALSDGTSSIVGAEYDGKYIITFISANANTVSGCLATPAPVKNAMLEAAREDASLKRLANEGIGLTYVFKSNTTEDQAVIIIEADEIK